MAAHTIQLDVLRFNFSMSKRYEPIKALEHFGFKKSRAKTKGEDAVTIFLEYVYKIEVLTGSADLQMSITIPFRLEPISEITIDDLYNCMILLQISVKEVVDAIFKTQEILPDTSIYSFEDMKEELTTFLFEIMSME